MAKTKEAAMDLFETRGAEGGTRVWEYPAKFDWSAAKVGDLVHFPQVRNWASPSAEPDYMEAVGRIRAKGKTEGTEKRCVEVEILYDDGIPRLSADLRTFVLD
ncbi:MAG TPA: hypothetical protein VEI97_14000 [bacterium]|nr:hypothetical protein [bacterium]